jgi:hypothetical protein
MISQASRGPVGKFIACASMIGTLSAGSPVFAASEERAAQESSVNSTKAEAIHNAEPQSLQAVKADMERLRPQLLLLRGSRHPTAVRAANFALKRMEIANAKTPDAFHTLVRQLPVTIVRRPAADGGASVVTEFISRGKVRFSLISASPTAPASQLNPEEDDHSAGPSVDGRWKSDGNGGCYWDGFDSGPDQCAPTTDGRWKSGGGGCYFDPNDEGPDQCLPPPTNTSGKCYDGEPPCATEEEMEDVVILLADTIAEIEGLQADLDYETAVAEDWCNNNPNADGCSAPSGPSASGYANCLSQASIATANMLLAVGASIAMYDYVTVGWSQGLRLSLLGKAAVIATALGASFTAGYWVGSVINCFIEYFYWLPTDNPLHAGALSCPIGAPAL